MKRTFLLFILERAKKKVAQSAQKKQRKKIIEAVARSPFFCCCTFSHSSKNGTPTESELMGKSEVKFCVAGQQIRNETDKKANECPSVRY